MSSSTTRLVLVGVAVGTTVSAKIPNLPENHPLVDFAPHIRCPYAELWLTKGPEQAAKELGLLDDVKQRKLQDADLSGSCSYMNQWSRAPACVEMRNTTAWSLQAMETKCAEMSGTLSQGTPCELPASLAGWCIQDTADLVGQAMAHPLALSERATCAAMKSTCQDMMQGTFEPGSQCEDSATSTSLATCQIAPGPIGAAHQAVYSGYRTDCPGTPGEGSPYMWPLQWSADTFSESMEFGSDEIKFTSRGRVYYHLDKNYKRGDTFYQNGYQRSIGQGPCPEEDQIDDDEGRIKVCRRNSEDLKTMLHRGAKMVFITWKNGTTVDMTTNVSLIETCRWLDLRVIGNIRPDWFMDARGDSTDTQYLGDQHVYHEGRPRLVKQWRKTDFASQYFTMSMLGNPGPDGKHWPMILNVPGEGFGDDHLRSYTNHTLLTEDDVDLFLLDEQYEAMGGSCPEMDRGEDNEGQNGPPTGGVHIPSNLEIDPNAWFSNVYTFSPVWEPPTTDAVKGGMSSSTDGVALTESGSTITASCYDEDTSSVHLTFTFKGVAADATSVAEVPWMAISKRETDECLMTPRGGGDAPTIFVMNDAMPGEADGKLTAFHGLLGPGAKNFGSGASGVTTIYSTLKPLEEMDGYSDVSVSVAGMDDATVSVQSSTSQTLPSELPANAGDVQLSFKLALSEGKAPEILHLNYAIGNTPVLGYHVSRECYAVESFPPCTSHSFTASHGGSDAQEDGDLESNTAAEATFGSVRGTASGAYSVAPMTLAVAGVAFALFFGN